MVGAQWSKLVGFGRCACIGRHLFVRCRQLLPHQILRRAMLRAGTLPAHLPLLRVRGELAQLRSGDPQGWACWRLTPIVVCGQAAVDSVAVGRSRWAVRGTVQHVHSPHIHSRAPHTAAASRTATRQPFLFFPRIPTTSRSVRNSRSVSVERDGRYRPVRSPLARLVAAPSVTCPVTKRVALPLDRRNPSLPLGSIPDCVHCCHCSMHRVLTECPAARSGQYAVCRVATTPMRSTQTSKHSQIGRKPVRFPAARPPPLHPPPSLSDSTN